MNIRIKVPPKPATGPEKKRPQRDYRTEYDDYQGRPKQLKERGNRNDARKIMAAAGLVRKGDGKHVDHKDMNPNNNSRTNLKVLPARANLKKQPIHKGRSRKV
jgi:hypothetical protein